MIKVVDALCGAGKTTWVFEHMKQNKDKKWIFVSPYLDEAGDGKTKGRIQKELPELNFASPASEPSKTASFLRHVNKGRNIAITHKLFTQFTPDVAEAIAEQGYELVIDETIDLVTFYDDLKGDDVLMLIRAGFVIVGEKGQLHWNIEEYPNYKGRDYDIRQLCELGCLWVYGDNVLIQRIPPTCMNACNSVTILTYLFEGSLMHSWMKLNNMNWEYYHPSTLRSASELKAIIREKINIIKPSKLINDLQFKENGMPINGAFNLTWYQRQNVPALESVKKSVEVTLKKTMQKGNVFWTTFKDWESVMSGVGYSRAKKIKGEMRKPFVSKNMRASNEYRDCVNCIHMVNTYPNGSLESHLQSFGVVIDRDKYALSELIQFVFRGSIRQHEEMDLYILSNRMRKLFTDWLSTDS